VGRSVSRSIVVVGCRGLRQELRAEMIGCGGWLVVDGPFRMTDWITESLTETELD